MQLTEPLKAIPIPVKPEDPDAVLDLQRMLEIAYERAGYELRVDYRREPNPPLHAEAAQMGRGDLFNAPRILNPCFPLNNREKDPDFLCLGIIRRWHGRLGHAKCLVGRYPGNSRFVDGRCLARAGRPCHQGAIKTGQVGLDLLRHFRGLGVVLFGLVEH